MILSQKMVKNLQIKFSCFNCNRSDLTFKGFNMWENEDYQKRVKNAFLNGVYVGNTYV